MSSKPLVETRDRARWLKIDQAGRRDALDRETMTLLRETVVRGGQGVSAFFKKRAATYKGR